MLSIPGISALAIGTIAIVVCIIQFSMFAARKNTWWLFWAGILSFATTSYASTTLMQMYVKTIEVAIITERFQYSIILICVHSIMSFTLIYLEIPCRRYQVIGGLVHVAILLIVWNTYLVISPDIIARNFILIETPYFDPRPGPFAGLYFFYTGSTMLVSISLWIKRYKKYHPDSMFFIAGFTVWGLLGLHDLLVILGMRSIMFLTQYGFLAFSLSLLAVSIRGYITLLREKSYVIASNKAKTALISNVSHELRTPLHAIMGFSELLQKSDQSRLTVLQKNHILQIIKSGKHLLELVNDLLDFSLYEENRLIIQNKPISLKQIAIETLDSIEPIAKNKSIKCEIFMPESDLNIMGDEKRIKQVMYNLMVNAIKFTPSGGTIKIKGRDEGERVAIAISDTGTGIPLSEQERIFEPFERLNIPEHHSSQGAGLGLALVKRFIDIHKGTIELTSKSGEGSTFTISFPVIPPHPEVPESISDKNPEDIRDTSMIKGRILVVEDNELNRRLMKNIFQFTSIEKDFAHSGQEGIDMALSRSYDLILMDIQLPDISGIEAFRAIRSSCTKEIPILALTALSMPEEIEKLIKIGFNGFIAKPFTINHFLKILSGWLNADEDHKQEQVPGS